MTAVNGELEPTYLQHARVGLLLDIGDLMNGCTVPVYYLADSICWACDGTGLLDGKPCVMCLSEKILLQSQYCKLTIPKGMTEGSVITVPGMGGEAIGRRPGRLDAIVHVRKHPDFEVRGYDLHVTVEVDEEEAEMGFLRLLRLPNGEKMLIRPPSSRLPITEEFVCYYKNKGLPMTAEGHPRGQLRLHIIPIEDWGSPEH